MSQTAVIMRSLLEETARRKDPATLPDRANNMAKAGLLPYDRLIQRNDDAQTGLQRYLYDLEEIEKRGDHFLLHELRYWKHMVDRERKFPYAPSDLATDFIMRMVETKSREGEKLFDSSRRLAVLKSIVVLRGAVIPRFPVKRRIALGLEREDLRPFGFYTHTDEKLMFALNDRLQQGVLDKDDKKFVASRMKRLRTMHTRKNASKTPVPLFNRAQRARAEMILLGSDWAIAQALALLVSATEEGESEDDKLLFKVNFDFVTDLWWQSFLEGPYRFRMTGAQMHRAHKVFVRLAFKNAYHNKAVIRAFREKFGLLNKQGVLSVPIWHVMPAQIELFTQELEPVREPEKEVKVTTLPDPNQLDFSAILKESSTGLVGSEAGGPSVWGF